MKDKLSYLSLLSCFFMASVLLSFKAHALPGFGFPGFGGGGGSPPAPVQEYDAEKQEMGFNPFYDFDEGEYSGATVEDPDYRMRDACFKGAAEQDLLAADDLEAQSTLAYDGSEDTLNTVQGAQPRECMPMKTTQRFSPLNLSPWYLISIVSPDRPEEYYQGPAYRGDRNPIFNRMRMVRPTETMRMGCSITPMVESLGGDADPLDPVWMRKELDNCLNQYILQQARFVRDPEDEDGEYFGVNTGLCQPFRLEIPPTKHELYEYMPSEYMGVAWVKLLTDSSYQYRTFARTEPDYEYHTKVRIKAQIPLPADQFGMILVEDLAEEEPTNLHFEKILDPSHPFSPRWDFELTDRSFSPLGVVYTDDPISGVRCSDDFTVDLLNFRQHMFIRWIPQKAGFNTACYLDRTPYGCYNVIWTALLSCSRGEPCCSTKWDVADKWESVLGEQIARAICGIPMREICNYVARPLTPMNTLKLREVNDENFGGHVPGLSPEDTVPEGYTFEEYFGDHKPYMRCWDTNTECGETEMTFSENVEGAGNYDFVYNVNSDIGSRYALMGAGREGGNGHESEGCIIGGGLGRETENPDPIASWSELKLYYVRAQRYGPKCIAIHSKLFKAYTGEEMLLSFTGAQWQQVFRDSTIGQMSRYRSQRWTYGWRGYISDPDEDERFPHFGGSPSFRTGLDNAIKGEILVYDESVAMGGGTVIDETWRNPYVAYVKDAVNQRFRDQISNAAIAATLDPAQDKVQVVAFNHGKYIDACGNSEELGMGADFTMYKTQLPSYYVELLDSLGEHTKECHDPRLSACIEPLWGDVKRYYISEDYRG